MAILYLDTSALIRRYDTTDPSAHEVRRVCDPSLGNAILIGQHTSVEVASALSAQLRTGALDSHTASKIWRLFRAHLARQYHVLALVDTVYAQAERLLFQHDLRGPDALHVACALGAAAHAPGAGLTFWTADTQQVRAAQAAGLDVLLIA